MEDNSMMNNIPNPDPNNPYLQTGLYQDANAVLPEDVQSYLNSPISPEQAAQRLRDLAGIPMPETNTQDLTNPGLAPSEQSELPVDQVIREMERKKAAQERPASSMETPSTNLIENFLNNNRRIGTAMSYLWNNMGDIIANAPQNIKNYFDSGKTVTDAYTDIANAMLANYNIDLNNLEGRTPGDVVKGILAGIYTNPTDFLLDFISFGGAGVAKKAISKIPGLSRAVKAGEVEKGIALQRADLAQKGLKAEEKLKEINKLADEAGISREQLFKAAEEGKDILPKGEKTEQLWNKLKSASDDFDELAKVYKPESYVGKEKMAITQKILRDRELVQPGITFEQVRREVTPYLDDMEKQGIDALLEPASKGDKVAKEIYNAKRLFDDNKIMPITHMLAEVNKSIGKAAVQAGKLTDDYVQAGRFTTRMYGNSTYADITEQWAKPQEYLTNLMDSYVNGGVASAILKGEFAPVARELGKFEKASYLDRQLLEQGKLREALKKASKEPVNLDDIAIDNDVLAPLKQQIDISGGAYGGALKQMANTAKGTMLSSLQYLGPNVITGAANALLNSGPMIVSDIIDAVRSKGKLAKNLGVYRYEKPAKISDIPILKQIDQINNWAGGRQARRADRSVQNVLAEIAAHTEMRRAGIPFKDRFKDVSQFDKAKLGEIIVDTKRAALINSPKTLLPDMVTDALSITNPFWRWTDTATQATYNVLKKSPVMSNILLCDIMGNIAFDKEMQNRLNLNVDFDKPYVTFKPDQNKPDHIKTISAEFIPMTTTLKFVDPKQWTEFPSSFALFGPIIEASKGLDRYGRPIKRPDINGVINQVSGTKRFEAGPGQPWHEIKGGKGDEIFSAAIKTFLGPVNLYNRTIAPLASPILSGNKQFYQPYGMSAFGSFNREANANMFQSANPAQGRTAQDVINAFTGRYEQEYHPEYDTVSPRLFRELTRGHAKTQLRLQGEGY